MCRLLCVRSKRAFPIVEQLRPFAQICQSSREYQGHGWGCSWLTNNEGTPGLHWTHYHSITPIWDDDLDAVVKSTSRTPLLIAHARSAFRDEGIVVENNMPFTDDHYVFAFNGELRGVRIKEQGRIGAEKIFNYIKRFENTDAPAGVQAMLDKGTRIIHKRTRYVRAMNIILSNGEDVVVSSHFGEDPDYFQLRRTERDGKQIICSDPWPDGRESEWQPIDNGASVNLTL